MKKLIWIRFAWLGLANFVGAASHAKQYRVTKKNIPILLTAGLLVCVGAACQFALPPANTTPPAATAIQGQDKNATVEPTAAPGSTVAEPTASPVSPTEQANAGEQATPVQDSGPQCTIKKNVNLRQGPGTAFQPPKGVLPAGTIVIPKGFQPKGAPGGSWVEAIEPVSGADGWISADPQFIQCNLDITTLPQVAFEPPPPQAPVVRNSQVDGTPNGLIGKVHFSPDTLMRMEVHAPDGSQDGYGIEQVTFLISDENGKVYERSEKNPAYCVFGGGEPDCNPWPRSGYQLLWGENGPPVKAGTYNVVITAQPTSAGGDESQFGKWFFTITVELP